MNEGFLISDIYEEARKILGGCNSAEIFRQLTHAIDLLSKTGDFDLLTGYLDICVTDHCVTLPREVETVLAVLAGGQPTLARDQLFRFHLNGPGDCATTCSYTWDDRGLVSTLQELGEPSLLVAFVAYEEDSNKELWVYGYDSSGNQLRTFYKGSWVPGYLVPTIFGYAVPDANAPYVSRITYVRKDVTSGPLRLSTIDNSGNTGVLLGVYEADETLPRYRRFRVNMDVDFIRIAFRRRVFRVRSVDDLVPLPSAPAVLHMLEALKNYKQGRLREGSAFESNARRWLTEAEWATATPTQMPIQVDGPTLQDPADEFVE